MNQMLYLIVIYKWECLCQKLHAVIEVQSIWFGNVINLDKRERHKGKKKKKDLMFHSQAKGS